MSEQTNQQQDTVNSSKQLGLRKFTPMIIQTKEELMIAMKEGKIKSSKDNLLSDKEKLFVELVCFGEIIEPLVTRNDLGPVALPHTKREGVGH